MTNFTIPLSVFSEIHQSMEYEGDDIHSFNDFESVATKKMESSLISVSEAPTDKYSRKGIPFYIIKVADILPPDVHEIKKNEYDHKLRPEYFLNYKKSLNPDVFLLAEEITEEMKIDNEEILQASSYLKNEFLGEFLKKLEEKEYFPLENYSLREIFHNNGINMRYLGRIAKYTVLPHLKQICLADMIARKIKTIFRYYIADFINYSFKYDKRKKSDIILTPTLRKRISEEKEKENKEDCEFNFCDFVVDFLNLIFGNSKDTDIFWQEILKKQILHHFEYEIPERKVISAGIVLNSVIFHCQFNINYDANINLFATPTPFQKTNFFGFNCITKTFGLKYLDINDMMKKTNNLNDLDYDLMEKFLKIQEAQEIALKCEDNYKLFNIKIKLIEIYFKKNQREAVLNEIEECLQIFNNNHPLQIRLFMQIIKSSFLEDRVDKAKSFLKKCESIAHFNFQNYHPIFIVLYDLFAEYFYEKNEVEKSRKYYEKSLNQSFKIFGVNHIQTAESLLKVAKMRLKLKEINDGLEDFIKAFHIIEAIHGVESNISSSMAYKISHLLIKNGF